MGISDNLGNKAKATKTKANQTQSIEGNELAIALQQSAIKQAESMAGLLQAYDAGMVQSADVVADAITERLDGRQFYGMVLERVAGKSKPVEIEQSFEPPIIDIPAANPFEEISESFRGLFGQSPKKALPFADLASEGETND